MVSSKFSGNVSGAALYMRDNSKIREYGQLPHHEVKKHASIGGFSSQEM